MWLGYVLRRYLWRNWIISEIDRIDVYLYILYGLFPSVNFPVASQQKHEAAIGQKL